MKKLLFRIAGILAALSAPLLMGSVAHAANHTWTGAGTPDGSGNLLFSDAANWDVAPTTDGTATLIFPKDKASDKITNDLTADTEFAGMDFTVDGSASGPSACPTTSFKISGNAILLAGNVRTVVSPAGTSCYFYPLIALNITLSANVSVIGSSNGSPSIGDTPVNTLNLSTFTLTLDSGYKNIYSNISGSGSMIITGADSSVELGGDNSAYTGAITVSSGATLLANGVSSLGSTSAGTTVQNGSVIQLCTKTDPIVYVEPLTIGGKGSVSGGYTGALRNGSCSMMGGGGGAYVPKNVEITGAIVLTANTEVNIADNLKISGPLSGSFTITAQSGGTGSLIVASSSNTSSTPNGTQAVQIVTTTYSDETVDNINVAQNNIVIVTGKRGNVDITGTLKGTGTVGNIIMWPGGILAPGLSPGCLNSGDLNLGVGTYQVELADLTACTEYDQTKVTGTVTLGGTLQIVRYDNMVPRLNNSFTIISNDGTDAVTGTFAGLAQGATTVVDGITYSISYTGGDGNDVVLVVTAVDSALGAPNTGAHIIKSGILLPVFAIFSAIAIIGMNFVATKKK